MPLWQTIHDLRSDADSLRRRPYGVIDMEDECLSAIHLRPWPKTISIPGVMVFGRRFHYLAEGNRCLLYYNQPMRHRNFLTLKYIVSSSHATLKTFRGSLMVLDEIARLKRSDAILCEASNQRISDRLFDRWGWEAHVPQSWRRHFIKRFYGKYPEPDAAWALVPHDRP